MGVSFDAYIQIKADGGHGLVDVCFRHAALRAVMQHEDIEMELSDSRPYGAESCVDCTKEKERAKAEGKK